MKSRRILNLGLIYFFADVIAIIGAYFTTLLLRFHSEWGDTLFTWINRTLRVRESGQVGDLFRDFYVGSAPRIILFLILVLTTLYSLWDLYAERRFLKRRPVAWNVILCNIMALAIFYAYFYLQRNLFHPRSMFATILFFNTVYTVALRATTDAVLRHLRTAHRLDLCPVVVVGRGRDADRILELMRLSPARSLFLAEQLDANPQAPFSAQLADIHAAVTRHDAGLVILADSRCSIAQIMQVLELADRLDVAVKILSRELDVLMTRASIEGDLIYSIPLVHFAAPSVARRFEHIKQLGARLLAAVAVVALSPLLIAIALLIRLTSRGPVLFIQERLGINNRPFRMFKFRTMIHDADGKRDALERHNESGPGLFKIRSDPRVTRLGRILRRYSLDELPQLFNVVMGDMTLVGPRPLPRRDFENYYAEWHYGRHNGLPGLTCLWQSSGRSDLDFHNMCVLDVYYLRNQNAVLDLKILLRTIRVVVLARGAY
ncbi:MAG: exopolysaccharide biosynthesis polyprenyl glycosylphosphotransferase [Lentisphaerae bacterium]|nr:exopolysaccharide biosynthesis polyprenyl glycosylphosphotransferase [Lentisphaerota bacterium]